jgi:hypothetical protein
MTNDVFFGFERVKSQSEAVRDEEMGTMFEVRA